MAHLPLTPTRTPPTAAPAISAVQKRTLTVLLVSQGLSGVGLAAGVTVAGLLAGQMLHNTSLSGLPIALLTAGSAVAAVVIGRVSQRIGRRPGLAAGYLTGALGGAGVVVAAALGSPALLFVSLFLYGAGTTSNLQARYAGADLAAPHQRARAASTVIVATTVGGIAGPLLVTPAGHLATALRLPELTGLFLLSTVAFTLAALTLLVWLRPDPLLLARTLSAPPAEGAPAVSPSRPQPGLLVGVVVLVLSQLVMVAVMTMTPIHMHAHGFGTAASGLVIALHTGSMYLPSPLAGRLVDRIGATAMSVVTAGTLLAAGVVAALAPGHSFTLIGHTRHERRQRHRQHQPRHFLAPLRPGRVSDGQGRGGQAEHHDRSGSRGRRRGVCASWAGTPRRRVPSARRRTGAWPSPNIAVCASC